ncbi:cell cycle checkpoint control protein RAD9A [Solanum tuberosum]|uniref:DNA repair protein rad9 n=2 Tax=Solanum tuberosum TaxID=4113 RepID=M1ABY2_SOLTU|nr:PREDICTED: cell cycle checkpoint control protein RAD9A [Solanum tuberosum]
MELRMSGNAVKTFARSITCLARIGAEVAIQASSTQLTFHTLNSSRSAYQSITFKPDFFDVFTVSAPQVQCSVLLKAICSVLRTPIASIDHLTVSLPNPDASKVQWTLNCHNGMRKAYWITCNVEPDIQHLSLDRRKLPSNFVVRPRDLNRLLSNFQTTLQEITIIATNPTCLPPDTATEIGGKAVELRSYIDPTKENDSSLHTQLWIDPTEEFVQYNHNANPVDVTFGVKESKAFLSFCEGCEVDIQIYFDKAGEPILMAPKFGLEDGSNSTFDATLVLATMLMSQLNTASSSENPQVAGTSYGQANDGRQAPVQERSKGNSGLPSDQTRIWSDLSGSRTKGGNDAEHGKERNESDNVQREIQKIGAIHISEAGAAGRNMSDIPNDFRSVVRNPLEEPQGMADLEGHASQHHPSNWVEADDDDDEGDESELCVQSTPPYH